MSLRFCIIVVCGDSSETSMLGSGGNEGAGSNDPKIVMDALRMGLLGGSSPCVLVLELVAHRSGSKKPPVDTAVNLSCNVFCC